MNPSVTFLTQFDLLQKTSLYVHVSIQNRYRGVPKIPLNPFAPKPVPKIIWGHRYSPAK